MSNSNKPAYHAFSVTSGETQDKANWTKIGVVWPHKKGDGFTLQLDCMPLDGRVVLRKPKVKSQTQTDVVEEL